LLELYLKSVGRGANLLLNVPPDIRGLIHENDSAALMNFLALRNQFNFSQALPSKTAVVINGRRKKAPSLKDGKIETFKIYINQTD